MVKCPECGANADLTKDGSYAHCASCTLFAGRDFFILDNVLMRWVGNTIFEPGKEGSHYRGSGSGSGDKEEGAKKDEAKKEGGAKGGS